MKGTPERSPSSADGTAGESLDTAANTSGAASDTSHTTSIFAVLMPPLHWSLMWLNNTIGGPFQQPVGYARLNPGGHAMAQRLTAADFDPEVLVLFDAYVHGALDRRGFLDKAKKYAVGGMSAAMLLDALSPKFAEAQQVKTDDARLETSSVEFPSPQGSGTARGYLVRPANVGRQEAARRSSSSTRTAA